MRKALSAPRRTQRMAIGLTGGIATGKTTATALLKQFGATVISCDELAHAALATGTATYRAILRIFGKRICRPDGTINRRTLGRRVFADAHARRQLEQIVHPFVIRRVLAAINRNRGILIVEVPLLFETGFERYVDKTIVVSCSEREQLRRLMKRSALTATEARRRLAAQMPLAMKRKKADWVLDNTSLARMIVQAGVLWNTVVARRTTTTKKKA